MMEKAKRKGFTQPASMLVKPIRMGGRKAVPSTIDSITQFTGKVKQNSAVLCGNLQSDDVWDKKWERYVAMEKLKRVILCALIALFATGLVLSGCAIIKMFMGV